MTTSVVSVQPRGLELARYLDAMSKFRNDPIGALAYCEGKAWKRTASVIRSIIAPLDQSAVDAGLAPVVSDLLELLRPMSVVSRLAGMHAVPMHARLLEQTAGGAAAWVAEAAPAPITAGAFAFRQQLGAKKIVGISVFSTELLNFATSTPTFSAAALTDGLAAVAATLDRAFCDATNAGDAATPASITHGAAASFESSGGSVADIDHDLGLLVDALIAANMTLATSAWLMRSSTLSYLSRLRTTSGELAYPGLNLRPGGTLFGLPVLASNTVTATNSPAESEIALVEASQVAIADNGATIETTTTAAVQMDNAPGAGAQQLVSLWQHNLTGLKVTRFADWGMRRPEGCAVLRSVAF